MLAFELGFEHLASELTLDHIENFAQGFDLARLQGRAGFVMVFVVAAQ
jgi:hypothetical protein